MFAQVTSKTLTTCKQDDKLFKRFDNYWKSFFLPTKINWRIVYYAPFQNNMDEACIVLLRVDYEKKKFLTACKSLKEVLN